MKPKSRYIMVFFRLATGSTRLLGKLTDLVGLAFWTDATGVASWHFERNEKLATAFDNANSWYDDQFGAVIAKMKSLSIA